MKFVRKIIPVDYLDMLGMEGWLEDMSRQGLHYVGCDSWSARFQRREPAPTRWHAEPSGSAPKGLVGEQVRYSAQRGWLCAGRLGRFDLYWTDDPEAEDFHTDPVAQSYTLDKLSKKMTRCALLFSLMLAALLAFQLWAAWDSAFGPVLRLVETSSFYTHFTTLLLLFLIGHFLWMVRGLRRLRRQLQEGVAAPHGRGWRHTGLPRQLYFALIALTGVCSIASTIYFFTGARWERELAALDRPAPVLSLAELEGSQSYVPDPFGYPGYEGPDKHNFVQYEWYPLSRLYEVDQQGYTPDSEDPFSLNMDWYDLRIAALAEPLLGDLMDYHLRDMQYEPERYVIEELTAPGFDRLVLARYTRYSRQELFACSGNRVLYLRYSGDQDLADRLELVAEVLHWEG